MWLEFKNATKYQIRQLFVQFYRPPKVDLVAVVLKGDDEDEIHNIGKKDIGSVEGKISDEQIKWHVKDGVNGYNLSLGKDGTSITAYEKVHNGNGHAGLAKIDRSDLIPSKSIDELAESP